MPTRSRARPWLIVATLSVASAVVAVMVSKWLFPLGSLNQDEPMYRYFAELLRHGKATLPENVDPLRPWASGYANGRVVMVYEPPWPALIMVAGAVFGSARAALALVTAATTAVTMLLARELFGGWRYAYAAGAVLLCTPLFIVQSSLFLSYTFQLLLTIGFLYLLLVGIHRDRWLAFTAAGFVGGLAIWARPYDGALLAGSAALWFTIHHRSQWRRGLRRIGYIAGGAVVPLAAMAAYTTHTMGGPLHSHFSVLGSANRPGFGERGIRDGQSFQFTLSKGITSTKLNLRWMLTWMFGGVVALPLIVIGGWRALRRDSFAWMPIILAAAFIAGYTAFWSPYAMVKDWHGVAYLGPFYHLSLLVAIVVFTAGGLVFVYEKQRAVALALLAPLAIVTAIGIPTKIDLNRQVTHDYQERKRALDATAAPRLVFVEGRVDYGFAIPVPFLQNTHNFTGPTVIAQDNGPYNFDVMDQFPTRLPVGFFAVDDPTEQGGYRYVPLPLTTSTRDRATIDVSVGEPTDAARVTAFAHWGADDDTQDRAVVLAATNATSRQDARWVLVAGAAPPAPDDSTLVLTGRGTVDLGFRYVSRDGVEVLTRGVTYVYRVVGDRVQLVEPPKAWVAGPFEARRPDNGGPLHAVVS